MDWEGGVLKCAYENVPRYIRLLHVGLNMHKTAYHYTEGHHYLPTRTAMVSVQNKRPHYCDLHHSTLAILVSLTQPKPTLHDSARLLGWTAHHAARVCSLLQHCPAPITSAALYSLLTWFASAATHTSELDSTAYSSCVFSTSRVSRGPS
jgi:hypothetical protein